MIQFLLIIGALALGGAITYYSLRGRLEITARANAKIEEQNKKIEADNAILMAEYSQISGDIIELNTRKNEISASIVDMNKQAELTKNTLFEQARQTAEASFEIATRQMADDYKEAEEEYKEEYQSILEELAQSIKQETLNYNVIKEANDLKIKEQKLALMKLEQVMAKAIEANKRALADKQEQEYYRILITDADMEDVEKLRSIAPMLRNREPLDKVIWKTYYEKPTAALLGRIVGAEVKTGIYKITNLETGMCYIGQSVDLATRIKAHIKAGLGIDSSNNKLYTALKEKGVENFTYEVIEECDRAQLNEQEKYWIKYFQSETFGYNSTKGNG